MKLPFHKAIRAFAIYMKMSTDRWVVPLYIVKMVDENRYKEAIMELDKQELLWPNDPEITFYRTLADFLQEG